MKIKAIAAIAIPSIIVLFGLIFGIMTWATYNTLVTADQQVKLKRANIVTALTARNAILETMWVAADTYLDHESDIYGQITDARSDYADALDSLTFEDLFEADLSTSLAYSSFLVVVEDNPEIQGDNVVMGYMATIEQREITLKNAREAYNAEATAFNTTIKKFPTILFAKMFDYTIEYPLWSLTEAA